MSVERLQSPMLLEMFKQQFKMVICNNLWVISVLMIVCACSDFVIAEYNATERDSLVKLRDYFMGELHSNWTGPPCIEGNTRSRWKGIKCSESGHVTEIFLENMGLAGSLPNDAFLNITQLRLVSFRNNSLSGLLPDLSQLVSLTNIFFSDNKFTGIIPLSLVKLNELKELYLENNELSGVIPPFNQQSLIKFNVSNNHLTGSIPDTPVLDSFEKSCYMGNDLLCGVPLNVSCRNTTVSSPNGQPSPASASPPKTNSAGLQKSSLRLGLVVIILTVAIF